MGACRWISAIAAAAFLMVASPLSLFAQVPAPAPTLTVSLMDLQTENVHIRLDWTDSTGETEYRIYRTQDETKLADFPASWTLIDTEPTGTTVYHDYSVQPYDTVLNPKATYYYKVVAWNVDGDAASNIDSETMPAVNGGSGGGGHGGGGCFIDASGGSSGSFPGGWVVLLVAVLLSAVIRRLRRLPLTGC